MFPLVHDDYLGGVGKRFLMSNVSVCRLIHWVM